MMFTIYTECHRSDLTATIWVSLLRKGPVQPFSQLGPNVAKPGEEGKNSESTNDDHHRNIITDDETFAVIRHTIKKARLVKTFI